MKFFYSLKRQNNYNSSPPKAMFVTKNQKNSMTAVKW